MNGIERIAAERRRQTECEGWTPEHDDDHTDGSLAAAAACYANPLAVVLDGHGLDIGEPNVGTIPIGWPDEWSSDWWKPSADSIRNLEKAGALIAAEIDRLLRARAKSQ